MAIDRWVSLAPLSVRVHSDNNASNYGRRFNLNGNNEPANASRMVPAYIMGIMFWMA